MAKLGALAGLRVLDLSQYIAGPYCTKLMADYGAEVIKVERPGSGDGARRLGPFPGDIPHPEKSGLFLYLNTNKESITLNLKTSSGASILKELVAQADILVESFRPGRMEGWELGYGVLSGINPRLVMCSVSNFGQTGPYRDYSATELVLQAMGGFLYACGDPSREPAWAPFPLAQYTAGLHAYIGSIAAEFHACSTGDGQHVDVSIMEALLSPQEPMMSAYFYSGDVRRRLGYRRNTNHPAHILPCKDGYVALLAVSAREWKDLTRLIGRPELADDPRFQTALQRVQYADELDEILSPWLAQNSATDIYHWAQQMRIPFAMVCSAKDVLESQQLRSREYFREVEHDGFKLSFPGPPFVMGESPAATPCSVPRLGEHNATVYCGRLGLSERELAAMVSAGII